MSDDRTVTFRSDVAFADAWGSQIETWIAAKGLRGYDRFDVRGHPLLKAVQPVRVLRRATSGAVEVFPRFSRWLLGIQPQLNAKAYALVALGSLRRYQVTHQEEHLSRAIEHLEWLAANPTAGYGELCWGYPFDVTARGLTTPRYTPIGVVCAIAGEAFALGHRVTGAPAHLEACCSIARFIRKHLPRMDQSDGTVCYAYTPGDRRRVHNANLHAAAHLLRTYLLTGDETLKDAALPAVEFTLNRQAADGSWPYGEYAPGEPFEAELLKIVDHHHTGFVLRSLFEIHAAAPSDNLRAKIDTGFGFYRDRLFDADGCPRTSAGRYPVDIHACAEGILCPSVLSAWTDEGLRMATRTMHWTADHMCDSRTGVPYYRMYPWFVSRLYCPRWGLAWVYYALCEYLYRAEARSKS